MAGSPKAPGPLSQTPVEAFDEYVRATREPASGTGPRIGQVLAHPEEHRSLEEFGRYCRALAKEIRIKNRKRAWAAKAAAVAEASRG
jgi:hypothetical protein